ncbi:MAG: MFS transporter [Clostridia bacterium]|nr:MFS transporter [Clostridia bacterium]
MKLNYTRTLLVGFAFFSIIAFWQAYDSIVPKILTDKFGLNQIWSGAIMALDNILAVVLLPVFGAVSDKHNGRYGRRTPFIVVGTVAASIALLLLSIADNMQRAALEANPALTPAEVTAANPGTLVLFMALLFVVLLSMAIYRSPAGALMPDVTPKPVRSKANAIINLMGTVGGILVLGLGILFGTGKPENARMSYTGFFAAVVVIMLGSLVCFLLTVREKKWAAEADEINASIEEPEEAPATPDAKPGLSKAELRSLFFILASVVLWYMGYNAVTSKYSVYAGEVLKLDFNMTLLVAQGAAILSYIPVGILSQRFGRKKTIIAGVIMLGTAFTCAAFMREGSNVVIMNILFALAGIGWATINVNSYPMAVELAKSGDVGKYTGYYYTASMAAQIITPVFSGVFRTYLGMTSLFPYAAIFVAGAFVTMLMVKHGDVKPVGKKSLLEHLDVDE